MEYIIIILFTILVGGSYVFVKKLLPKISSSFNELKELLKSINELKDPLKAIRDLQDSQKELRQSIKQFRELSKGRHEKHLAVSAKSLDYTKSINKNINKNDLITYRQIESLLELNGLLGFNITGLRGWAISPDAAVILHKDIIEHKPNIVVELGGGLSSVVVAHALKQNGKGKLISIDHDKEYAKITKEKVKNAGLEKHVDIRVASLKNLSSPLKGKWYDPAVVTKGISVIDYVIVDGPPEGTNKSAREPAVLVLKDKLSPSVRIFMDDSDRIDEANAIKKWLNILDHHEVVTYQTEKGTAVLQKK